MQEAQKGEVHLCGMGSRGQGNKAERAWMMHTVLNQGPVFIGFSHAKPQKAVRPFTVTCRRHGTGNRCGSPATSPPASFCVVWASLECLSVLRMGLFRSVAGQPAHAFKFRCNVCTAVSRAVYSSLHMAVCIMVSRMQAFVGFGFSPDRC